MYLTACGSPHALSDKRASNGVRRAKVYASMPEGLAHTRYKWCAYQLWLDKPFFSGETPISAAG